MARLALPPLDTLRQLLDYDPITGQMAWKDVGSESLPPTNRYTSADRARLWNGQYAGKPAGSITARGYLRVTVMGCPYYAQRLAWLLYYGKEPETDIDHINGNRCDNRIANLRLATPEINSRNRVRTIVSNSGFRGVYRRGEKYMAAVKVRGKMISLGRYEDLRDAIRARLEYDKENGFTLRHRLG